MAKQLLEIECPCCQATLKIDPQTRAVITYKEKEKPKPVEDLRAAVEKLKGEEARRDEVFRKSMADQKTYQQVLDRKFDELLKQAKSNPDVKPPAKDIDLD
ncbi:MAG: hypothetical protein ACRD44_15630 [Bryobacteraceae bacterium]